MMHESDIAAQLDAVNKNIKTHIEKAMADLTFLNGVLSDQGMLYVPVPVENVVTINGLMKVRSLLLSYQKDGHG